MRVLKAEKAMAVNGKESPKENECVRERFEGCVVENLTCNQDLKPSDIYIFGVNSWKASDCGWDWHSSVAA